MREAVDYMSRDPEYVATTEDIDKSNAHWAWGVTRDGAHRKLPRGMRLKILAHLLTGIADSFERLLVSIDVDEREQTAVLYKGRWFEQQDEAKRQQDDRRLHSRSRSRTRSRTRSRSPARPAYSPTSPTYSPPTSSSPCF